MFNMAQSYSDATVFDCQVKAHKEFFEDELPSVCELLSQKDVRHKLSLICMKMNPVGETQIKRKDNYNTES